MLFLIPWDHHFVLSSIYKELPRFFPLVILLSLAGISHTRAWPCPNMETTQAYAVAAGGIIILFFLANALPYFTRLIKFVLSFTSQHLTYPYFLSRHRLFGPWTRADVLIHLIYVTANVFCLSFRASTVSQAGLRAGILSLINAVPLFAGPHLSFLADVLGVSVITYRHFHRSAGLMSFCLVLFHVLVAVVGRGSFSISTSKPLFGVIVSSRPVLPCPH